MVAVTDLGVPLGLDVDLASGFSLMLDLKPLVEAAVDGEGGELAGALADGLVATDLVVPDVEVKIVADVMNFNHPGVGVPLGVLAVVVANDGLPLLLAAGHLDVRINLTDCRDVVS